MKTSEERIEQAEEASKLLNSTTDPDVAMIILASVQCFATMAVAAAVQELKEPAKEPEKPEWMVLLTTNAPAGYVLCGEIGLENLSDTWPNGSYVGYRVYRRIDK